MILRILENKLETQLGKGKAIILTGPRQVGKTTLLQKIAQKHKALWLNADEPDVRLALEHATSTKLKALIGKHKLLIIDEAQLIDNIGRVLKLITDNLKTVQVIATGPSAFDLRNKTNEPLTGRKIEYNLYPFSVRELEKSGTALNERRLLETRMIYGLYPEVVNRPGEEQEVLRELVSSYLYKDILMIDGLKKASMLEKLIQALALQLGNEVSYHELGQLLGGVDHSTIEKYIDLLEKAYIIYRLPALNRNLRNELKKGKKIYFWDTGIRNAVIKNFNPLELRQDKGALWENFIISEKLKNNSYQGKWVNSFFWRTLAQQEIDYVEEYAGKIFAFEFKWNPKQNVKITKTFLNAYPNAVAKVISPENMDEFLNQK